MFWMLALLLIGSGYQFASASSGTTFSLYLPQVLFQGPPSRSVHPDDLYFDERQWPLRQVSANEGWSITTGDEVVIAIIDTGVDYTHPDLVDHLVERSLWRNFLIDESPDNDTNPMDGNGHGTHVAGIAAAVSNNREGITGMSWGARILPLKVLRDNDGSGPTSGIAMAVQYAADQGAQVINLSLGSPSYNQALQDAIRYARSKNVVVIAAAGNYYQEGNRLSYPGALEYVLAVAGTTRTDGHACYSNTGSYVDVSAPGGQAWPCPAPMQVWSTLPVERGGYGWKSGTSMAAPLVSGLAALLLTEQPNLTPDHVDYLIVTTAEDLGEPGWDPIFGAGRIDARRALEAAWYLSYHRMVQEQHTAGFSSQSAATDCSVPHAENQILVRASRAGTMAAQKSRALRDASLMAELPEWQLWRVPDGHACSVMQALNRADEGVVAELDVLSFTMD